MKKGVRAGDVPGVVDALADGGEDGHAGDEQAQEGDGAEGAPGLGDALDEVQDVVGGDGDVGDDALDHALLLLGGVVDVAEQGDPRQREGEDGEEGPVGDARSDVRTVVGEEVRKDHAGKDGQSVEHPIVLSLTGGPCGPRVHTLFKLYTQGRMGLSRRGRGPTTGAGTRGFRSR